MRRGLMEEVAVEDLNETAVAVINDDKHRRRLRAFR